MVVTMITGLERWLGIADVPLSHVPFFRKKRVKLILCTTLYFCLSALIIDLEIIKKTVYNRERVSLRTKIQSRSLRCDLPLPSSNTLGNNRGVFRICVAHTADKVRTVGVRGNIAQRQGHATRPLDAQWQVDPDYIGGVVVTEISILPSEYVAPTIEAWTIHVAFVCWYCFLAIISTSSRGDLIMCTMPLLYPVPSPASESTDCNMFLVIRIPLLSTYFCGT